jgi:hypothetical protein
MDATAEFIRQGLLGVIVVVLAGVVVFLYKQLQNSYDKRITDLDQYKEVFLSTAKDLLTSNQNLQKAVDGIVTILQNVKFKK